MNEQLFKAAFDFGCAPCAEGYTKVTEDTWYSRETGYGFVKDNMIQISSADRGGEPLKRDFCCGNRDDVPVRFDIDVPHNGTYHVKVLIGDYNEDAVVTIQTEWRRFMVSNRKIRAGEFLEAEFTVNVCDVHRKDEPRFIDRTLNIAVLGDKPCLNAIVVEEAVDVPTIYIAGDSTVTDQSANYPYRPQSTYCGWGQMIGQYLKKGVAVSNHAQSGLTTETFMGVHWEVVKERIKKGDFLFMQFGHNDQKVEKLRAFTGYYENLKYYIDYARKAGVQPVLCTPINRIIFEEDGSLRDLLGEYGLAVKTLAKEENVPCIDLLAKTTEFFTAQGDVDAWNYFWGDGVNRDYTHTNDFGGDIIARFVAQGIVENNILPIADYVKKDCIDVVFPKEKAKKAKQSNKAKDLNPIDNVGLVNIPKLKDIKGRSDEDIIKELAARGIVDAFEDGMFLPDEPLNVGSAIFWAARAAGIKDEDVLNAAASKRLIPFVPDEKDVPILREELATLIVSSYNYRAPDRAIVGNIDQYADKYEISPERLDDVRAANELGVMKGVSDTEYAPKKELSRAEAAEIFHRLIHTK
ncbi:MAG: S-layer homology domain-containing protein [Clostridia bacterium]|nr:S-layer homology domain-containing protein [Clostridia bacterium]